MSYFLSKTLSKESKDIKKKKASISNDNADGNIPHHRGSDKIKSNDKKLRQSPSSIVLNISQVDSDAAV